MALFGKWSPLRLSPDWLFLQVVVGIIHQANSKYNSSKFKLGFDVSDVEMFGFITFLCHLGRRFNYHCLNQT